MVFMVPLLIMATSLVSKINTRVALVKGWVNSFLAFMGQLYIGFYTGSLLLTFCRSADRFASSSGDGPLATHTDDSSVAAPCSQPAYDPPQSVTHPTLSGSSRTAKNLGLTRLHGQCSGVTHRSSSR